MRSLRRMWASPQGMVRQTRVRGAPPRPRGKVVSARGACVPSWSPGRPEIGCKRREGWVPPRVTKMEAPLHDDAAHQPALQRVQVSQVCKGPEGCSTSGGAMSAPPSSCVEGLGGWCRGCKRAGRGVQEAAASYCRGLQGGGIYQCRRCKHRNCRVSTWNPEGEGEIFGHARGRPSHIASFGHLRTKVLSEVVRAGPVDARVFYPAGTLACSYV